MKIVILAVMSLLFVISSASAESGLTVADVIEHCRPPADAKNDKGIVPYLEYIKCMAYLEGLFDGFSVMSDFNAEGFEVQICPPAKGLPVIEVVNIALASMRTEKNKSVRARTAALAAWMQKFKCPKRPSSAMEAVPPNVEVLEEVPFSGTPKE